jgi:TRAP-type C4-dicarboxylate transport system permease small subunit
MENLMRQIHKMTFFAAWFGGALILTAAFIVGIEVVIRKVFNISIGGADELAGFALASACAWSFGFALCERSHIRIDFIYRWLPQRLKAILDVMSITSFVFFFVLITWRSTVLFIESVELNAHAISPLATPLAYPQALWVTGLVMVCVIGLILLIRVLQALVVGDLTTVFRLAGPKSISEEVADELKIEKEMQSNSFGSKDEGHRQ